MDLAFCCAYIKYQSDCRKFGKHSRGNFLCASHLNKNHYQGCALQKLKGAQCSKLWNPGCPAYDLRKISTCIPSQKEHKPPYKDQGEDAWLQVGPLDNARAHSWLFMLHIHELIPIVPRLARFITSSCAKSVYHVSCYLPAKSAGPSILIFNESLRVSDTKRGEPQEIFACRGEGHGQLRVTMITPPPT